MNLKHHKKKQPQIVRANLLEAAAQLIVERGLAGVTLEQVAQKAGVSKGGLIHHFSSKQALIEELNRELLETYEKNIEAFIAADPEPRGRFMRSYIKATFMPLKSYDSAKLFSALALAVCHNESLGCVCRDWYGGLEAKHGQDLRSPKAQMLRYATDGIWLEDCTGMASVSAEERRTIIDYLIRQTYEL